MFAEKVEKSFSQNVFKANGSNLQCRIKFLKVFSNNQKCLSPGGICPCHWAIYMYKIEKKLNVFFSGNALAIFARFHKFHPHPAPPLRDKILIVVNMFYYFNNTSYVSASSL